MDPKYCPTIGREVRLDRSTPDEPVCPGYDPDLCAGLCPLTGYHAVEMGRRFALAFGHHRRLITTTARCFRCEDTVPMYLVSNAHLFCTSCGDVSLRFN